MKCGREPCLSGFKAPCDTTLTERLQLGAELMLAQASLWSLSRECDFSLCVPLLEIPGTNLFFFFCGMMHDMFRVKQIYHRKQLEQRSLVLMIFFFSSIVSGESLTHCPVTLTRQRRVKIVNSRAFCIWNLRLLLFGTLCCQAPDILSVL